MKANARININALSSSTKAKEPVIELIQFQYYYASVLLYIRYS